jgi:hypothetical protein
VQGEIATGLISVYEGLGGGWEIRLTGCPAPPPAPPADETLPAPRLATWESELRQPRDASGEVSIHSASRAR